MTTFSIAYNFQIAKYLFDCCFLNGIVFHFLKKDFNYAPLMTGVPS